MKTYRDKSMKLVRFQRYEYERDRNDVPETKRPCGAVLLCPVYTSHTDEER